MGIEKLVLMPRIMAGRNVENVTQLVVPSLAQL
jgi:hypothetical protein